MMVLILSLAMLWGCRDGDRDELNLQLAKKLMIADLAYCTRTGVTHASSTQVLLAGAILKENILYKCKDGVGREYVWLGEYTNESHSGLVLFYSPEISSDGKILVARLGGQIEYVDISIAEKQIAQCAEYLRRYKNAKPYESIPVPLLDKVGFPK